LEQLDADIAAALLSAWLVARANDQRFHLASDVVAWFAQGQEMRADFLYLDAAFSQVIRSLRTMPRGEYLDDLLPYILEAFQGQAPQSVRDGGAGWAAKRASGTFYTPSDVADHIAAGSLAELGNVTAVPNCLDPAMG